VLLIGLSCSRSFRIQATAFFYWEVKTWRDIFSQTYQSPVDIEQQLNVFSRAGSHSQVLIQPHIGSLAGARRCRTRHRSGNGEIDHDELSSDGRSHCPDPGLPGRALAQPWSDLPAHSAATAVKAVPAAKPDPSSAPRAMPAVP
jgi:hypothetical protein